MAGHGSPPAEDKANHPGRKVGRYEIVPTTRTGSERVEHALVGEGPGSEYHTSKRFPTLPAAQAHMEKHNLGHTAPRKGVGY